MPLPLIPIGIGLLAGGAFWKHKKTKGMTPERKKIYEAAMNTLKDPNKLRLLSDAFQKAGLKTEAEMLRKKALLRELPEGQKKARRDAFKAGLKATDPSKVETLANAFHKQGALGAAKKLRDHAAGLKKAG
jgi:hypothetical protein